MGFLPADLYATIERSVPIVCVDLVPVEVLEGDVSRVGLIRRRSPFGEVWCHLGGRILHGETIGAALSRHFHDSVTGADLVLGSDPQPQRVHQWFPPELTPAEPPTGVDPRKHAVALTFVTPFTGHPTVSPGGEALEFALFRPSDLPTPMWPGSAELIRLVLDDPY